MSGRHKAETRYATCQKGDKGPRRHKGGSKGSDFRLCPEGAEAVVFMTHKAGKKSAQKNTRVQATAKEKGPEETVSGQVFVI